MDRRAETIIHRVSTAQEHRGGGRFQPDKNPEWLTPVEEHLVKRVEVYASQGLLGPEFINILISSEYRAVLEERLEMLLELKANTGN